MNKRIILTILTVVMIFALLLSGCTTSPAEQNGDVLDNTNDAIQGASTGKTPSESFNRFLDAKGKGYDSLDDKMGNNMDVALELLTMSMIDLETIAITLLTDDIESSKIAGDFLGMNGMNITYSNENFSFSYSGASDEVIAAEGKYDAKTDSLTCVWTKDGNETLMLEYTMYNDGYAGQYFITAEDGKTSVIKVITDGDDIGVGMGNATEHPSSIYKAAPSDFSFVDGLSSIFVIQDGQVTSTMNGTETLF